MTEDELEDEVMERIAILMQDDPGPAPPDIIRQAWAEVRARSINGPDVGAVDHD